MTVKKRKAGYKRAEMSSKKMLSNISHDIKTPMTVILGYLEIMRLNPNEENTRMLQKVEATARRVMELMNQFFTLAKLEAGDTKITLESVNVSEICRESILEFYELLNNKEIRLELDIQEQPSTLMPIKMLYSEFCSISLPMPFDMEWMENILESSYGPIKRKFILILQIKAEGSKKNSSIPFLKDYIQWRIPGIVQCRKRSWINDCKNLALQLGGDLTLKSQPYQKTVFTVSLKEDR